MKSYKEYGGIPLGTSDSARIMLAGVKDARFINFGEDGFYHAYLVDENATIGEHYKLQFEMDGSAGASVYDDVERMATIPRCDVIKVYRAGNFGCIIQCINQKQD